MTMIGVRVIPAKVVVAVMGAVEDWAAYEGPENKDNQWIMDHGDKLSEDEARDLFPAFTHLHYRR